MSIPTGGPERRRHLRIEAKGTVILKALAPLQRGRIGNLGEGGLFVLTEISVPDRWLGRTLEVEIRLDGAHAEWLRGIGRIVGIKSDGIAISFETPPPALLRMIDELTTASRASDRVMSVVLIDADDDRRAVMAAGFRATGCAVIEASTPLEAIVRLGETSFEPDVIAIADSLATNDAQHMRTFVERNHPTARLITISNELCEPDGILHWLSSQDPNVDLPDRVREVLVQSPRRTRS